jgi:hypothetical protein
MMMMMMMSAKEVESGVGKKERASEQAKKNSKIM